MEPIWLGSVAMSTTSFSNRDRVYNGDQMVVVAPPITFRRFLLYPAIQA
jgi:hypothetical protein